MVTLDTGGVRQNKRSNPGNILVPPWCDVVLCGGEAIIAAGRCLC